MDKEVGLFIYCCNLFLKAYFSPNKITSPSDTPIELANTSSNDPTRLLVHKLWAISIKIPVEIAINIDINKLDFDLFLNFIDDLDRQKYKIMTSPPYAVA
jgi:hypothetical protein